MVAAGVLTVYCALNLRVGTDLTHFIPDGAQSELARVSGELAQSPFTRTMVLSIAADEIGQAIDAAQQLARELRESPEVEWVRGGVDPDQLQDIYALYFPRRYYFLSDDPERELPAQLDSTALRERARELKTRLASPASTLLSRIAPEDPISGFESIVERFRKGERALELQDGQWVTRDGRYAILLLSTHASAFESGSQAQLLALIDERFAAIAQAHSGDLVLEMSGANRFAVAAEQSIKADVYKIAVVSFSGVAALFVAFIGGWRSFLIVSVPPLAGILVATSAGVAFLGGLDGLTMAFGASLMGIAIDYSNHVLIHHRLATDGRSPQETARRLRPSLSLGAATTISSFGGLAITAFPAFREMSFFAAVGVFTALLASLIPMPALVHFAPELPQRSARIANWLGDRLHDLEQIPRSVLWIPLALLPFASIPLANLEWSDDMSKLTRFPGALMEEGRRVRERVSSVDSNRFAIGIAENPEKALALNERIHGHLEQAVDAGELDSFRSLHGLLWSEGLQRRNRAVLDSDTELYQRLDEAFSAEGFRPGAFAAFERALAESPPAPLTLADLQSSPLGDFLAPFVVPIGERFAVVTYLNGLREPARVRLRLDGLDRVHILDQGSFVNQIYGEFRTNTLQQIVIGAGLVLLMLILRYRAWRPVAAAFLPSVTVAVLLLALFSLLGIRPNLLHAMSLIMVMGMGVDYGVFLVDSADDREATGATMLSLLMSCMTTVFVFGTLAISSQPSLRSIGVTTGLGIAMSYVLAPVMLGAVGMIRASKPDA
jgi:predicted exporter